MEQAQNTRAQAPTQGVSPLKAAAALLLIVALAAAAWSFAGRSSDPASTQAPLPQAPAVPSEQEIIAEFKRLDALRIQAFETVDPSLISKIAYPGSPFYETVSRELQVLQQSDVTPQVRKTTLELAITEVSVTQAELVQVVVERVRFIDERGQDVTMNYIPLRRRIDWTLRHDGSRWLIYDGVFVKSRPVKR